MLEIYLSLLPVFGWFLLGAMPRQLGWVKQVHGEKLLKFMFFVTLPVLIFVKITGAEIGMSQLYLPFFNIVINLCCLSIMFLWVRGKNIDRPILGVMLVSSAITNNFFAFPFIHPVLGDDVLANAIIFDLGNAISTLTLAYIIAFTYGPEELKLRNMVANIFKLPAMWALIAALIFKINDLVLPPPWASVLERFGLLTNVLILISLGIMFNLKIRRPKLTFAVVFIRMLCGLLISIGCVMLFELQGSMAMVVIICGAAPIGFNALTYSSLARLDMDFASSTVSASILAGLFTIPALMYILKNIYG